MIPLLWVVLYLVTAACVLALMLANRTLRRELSSTLHTELVVSVDDRPLLRCSLVQLAMMVQVTDGVLRDTFVAPRDSVVRITALDDRPRPVD